VVSKLIWRPIEEYDGGLAIFYYPETRTRTGGFGLLTMYKIGRARPLIPRQPTLFARFNQP
jgi:hypothetical protein